MDIWVGLDLGQLTDFTAAAVIRRSVLIDPATRLPERRSRTAGGGFLYRFDAQAIKRYQLGTPYTTIVSHVVEQLRRPELGPKPRLVIDGSGVGVAVVEMFRTALKRFPEIEVHSITITSGRGWSQVGRGMWNVAKVELTGAIREALESRRLKVPPQLGHSDLLKRELLDFKVRITAAANETFAAREGTHDDLVLAVALPVWLANQRQFEMQVDDALEIRPLTREMNAVATEREQLEQDERQALQAEAQAIRRAREEQREWDRLNDENCVEWLDL
jgi:hypothetical protein